MENHIDQIEKFLRGQMSQEEEEILKTVLIADIRLRSYAFIMVNILRKQKTG